MRYFDLDFIRGFAVVLMIVFHLCFDLNHFHYIEIDIYRGEFWHYFRFVIVTLFLLCVGISLYIVNEKGYNLQKDLRRFFIILANALAVSVASYFIFPNSFIYFGILHFIAVASILALPFVKFPKIALIVGVLIIALTLLDLINMHWLYDMLAKPLFLPVRTEDLVPLTPWFGVVLIGIYFGYAKAFIINIPQNGVTEKISFLGKHALLAYMLHQPILFGSFYLISLAA